MGGVWPGWAGGRAGPPGQFRVVGVRAQKAGARLKPRGVCSADSLRSQRSRGVSETVPAAGGRIFLNPGPCGCGGPCRSVAARVGPRRQTSWPFQEVYSVGAKNTPRPMAICHPMRDRDLRLKNAEKLRCLVSPRQGVVSNCVLACYGNRALAAWEGVLVPGARPRPRNGRELGSKRFAEARDIDLDIPIEKSIRTRHLEIGREATRVGKGPPGGKTGSPTSATSPVHLYSGKGLNNGAPYCRCGCGGLSPDPAPQPPTARTPL
eukprot:COSAG04_NODE_411_length_14759_cov_28.639520_12_plen_264_part_00